MGVWDGLDECEISRPEILSQSAPGYYYQVQAQLHIVDAEYCDFVVLNSNGTFFESITPDMIPRAEIFSETAYFQKCWDSKLQNNILTCNISGRIVKIFQGGWCGRVWGGGSCG